MDRTLVIGDLHGHYDRLEALLTQEGIVGTCPDCEGMGDILIAQPDNTQFCDRCQGDGIARIDFDTKVILVGDVGHFGVGGSATGDLITWKAALAWTDVILWGNHDRAVFEPQHEHRGLDKGFPETLHLIKIALAEGKLKLAVEDHGFLITHAGVHPGIFNKGNLPDEIADNPSKFADWINEINAPEDFIDPREGQNYHQNLVRDAISNRRGGRHPYGGILWRDIEEALYKGFRQIFGHSADYKEYQVRYCYDHVNTRKPDLITDPSYCIDVGGKGDKIEENCLAGIYLPDETIVRVDLNRAMPIIGVE